MATNQELINSIITNLNSLLSPATSEKSGLMTATMMNACINALGRGGENSDLIGQFCKILTDVNHDQSKNPSDWNDAEPGVYYVDMDHRSSYQNYPPLSYNGGISLPPTSFYFGVETLTKPSFSIVIVGVANAQLLGYKQEVSAYNMDRYQIWIDFCQTASPLIMGNFQINTRYRSKGIKLDGSTYYKWQPWDNAQKFTKNPTVKIHKFTNSATKTISAGGTIMNTIGHFGYFTGNEGYYITTTGIYYVKVGNTAPYPVTCDEDITVPTGTSLLFLYS